MNIEINKTPVRTSRNFGINNIRIDEVEIPKNVEAFTTYNIDSKKSIVSNDVNFSVLTYGNGKELEENIIKNANNKLKIETKKENIKIVYEFDDKNLNLINQIDIVGKEDANIIIEYNSNTNQKCFHNGIIKVLANENCKLNIVIINLLNNNSLNLESIETKILKNAIVNYTIVDIGAKKSIVNYYANCLGENSNNDLKNIYLGKENEIKDLNYIAHLYGKKSMVDIDAQGAIDGNCKKNFKGTIDFKKGCKKAKGNEKEFCLLLSEEAKSIALPMLLASEEDVEGNHSTASGKVEKEILFYIMSRGISYKDAVKLIVKSRFNKIIERIQDEEVKNRVISQIDRRLD